MNKKSKIKCAVIGVGYLGKFHAEKYHNLPNADLVAVCDFDAQRAQEVATAYNTRAYTDYQQLIADAKPDAVSIVVPTSLHHEVSKIFLQNNIHILLEKPITTTIEEAEELINIAQNNNLVLQVGHLERFNPVLLTIQKQLNQPMIIESVRLAPFKLRGTDVSVILDLMIHDIDIVQHIVQSPIKSIQASGAPVLSEHIDIANARIEFNNGCIANFTASRISTKAKRKLRVFQHDTYFSGDLDSKTLTVSRKGTSNTMPNTPEIIKEELTLEKNDAIMEEIKAFLDSITNKTPPLVSGEDGKKALATALQITAQAMSRWQQYLQK